jgi:hypothetical protein
MPIDSDFPKNNQVIGKHKRAEDNIIISYGDQEDQMQKHLQNQKSRKHTILKNIFH